MKTTRIRKEVLGLLGVALLMLLTVAEVNAQSSKLRQADKDYENYAYVEAIKVYEQLALKGYRSIEMFQRLGDGYYFNARYRESAKWYGELFAMSAEQPSEYYLRYSQSLKSVGNDLLAKQYYDKYLSTVSTQGRDYVSAEQYLDLIAENSGRYDIEMLSINSTQGFDFGTAFYGDQKVVFASNRGSSIRGRTSSWDGMSYLDLYEATIDAEGTLSAPVKLKGSINSKYHESTQAFTPDGTTVYFTRNNQTSEQRGGKEKTINLKIYRATINDGKWEQIEDLSINSDHYSTAHPALSADGSKLYFSSDRPGGYGGTDLYVVDIASDGTLGVAQNLGPKINTSGRESFPYVNADNELYFSSDGHFGLGGYDVFYVKLDTDSQPQSRILNVGEPINSSGDDLAYVVRDSKGYVSSNRAEEGNSGNYYDNIYRFVENQPIKDVFIKSRIFGVVTDKISGFPLANTTIKIVDERGKEIADLRTDDKGFYQQEVDFNEDYIINATKEEYSGADAFSRKGRKEREHNLELYRMAKEVEVGDDLAKLLNIIIYFDLDKYNIRPDAQVELEKLVSVMKDNPSIKVDVRSHTDSRASDSYNMTLSANRAKSTVEYLVSRGIDRSRLTGRGYGETQLVNWCANGVDCSEEEHQQNRRSEFIVLEK